MPVTAYVIRNLFWDGTTHKVPNSNPLRLAHKTRVFKRKPQIIDYLGGSIALEGEDWNYLRYKDDYYFLSKNKVLDVKRNRFLYTLVKDVWVSTILRNKVTILGDLAATRDEDLVRSNLNRCFKILDNPAKLIRLNFKEEKYDWKKSCVVRPITRQLRQRVLSKREFANFLNTVNLPILRNFDASIPIYYEKRKTVFVLDYLRGAEILGWKEKVKTLINNSLQDLSKKQLTKLTMPANSPLIGSYCIADADADQIGTVETAYSVETIDLSGLKDIKVIGTSTLRESVPLTELTEDTALFDVPQNQQLSKEDFILKTKAKIYFPYNKLYYQGYQQSYCRDALSTGFKKSLADQKRGRNPLAQQTIEWVDYYNQTAGTQTSWLSWWPQVDFVLTWSELTTYDSKFHLGHEDFSTMSYSWSAYLRPFFGKFETPTAEYFFPIAKFGKTQGTGLIPVDENEPYRFTFPTVPWEWKHDSNYSPNAMFGAGAPNYGWLIYQLHRPYDEWDLYKYRGRKTNKVEWYSGLKKNFLDWTRSYKGYSAMYDALFYYRCYDRRLQGISGSKEFTSMTFMLDHLLWYALVPNDFYSNSGYPWSTDDFYDLKQSGAIASGWNIGYISWTAGEAALWGDPNPLRNKGAYYSQHARRKYQQLEQITFREFLNLPSELNTGDYLFSSLEYDWWYTGLGHCFPSSLSEIGREQITNWHGTQHMKYLGDLHRSENEFLYPSKKLFDHMHNTVVICRDVNNSFEFRGFEVFQQDQTLRKDPEQIIKKVDGQTSQQITYTKMSKFGILDTSFNAGQGISADLRKRIIYLFYKLKGKNIEITAGSLNSGPFNAQWEWITDEQLAGTAGTLFDLVGTDWYAFILKNKVYLIAKTPDLISARKDQVNYLDTSKLTEKYDTIDLVNQRALINIYTKSYPISNKFSLQQGDSFDVEVRAITPSVSTSQFEHFFVDIKNDWDRIYEYIQVDKKPTAGIALQTQFQLESLKMNLARNEQDYDFNTERFINFAREKLDTQLTRRKWDLDFEKSQFDIERGYSSLSGAYGLLKGTVTAPFRQAFKFGHAVASKTPLNIAFSGFNAFDTAFSAFEGIADFAKQQEKFALQEQQFTERYKRFEVDKEYAFREHAMNVYGIEKDYVRRRQDLALQINSQTNMFWRAAINDRSTLEDLNKVEKLNDINLSIWLPTHEQKKAIKAYVNEFGYDCDIPRVQIELYPGMAEQVIKFRNLNDDSIRGIDSKIERDILISKLSQGIKIVDIEQEEQELEVQVTNEKEELKLRLIEREKELEELRLQLDHQEQIVDELQVRLHRSDRSTAEVRQELHEVKLQLEEAKQRIAELEAQAAEKEKELEEARKKMAEYLDEIEKLKQSQAALNNTISGLRTGIAECRTRLTQTMAEKTSLNTQLNNLQSRFHTLSESYREKETEIAEQTKVKDLYRFEKDELAQKLKKAQEDYEAEKKKLEGEIEKKAEEISEKNKEIESWQSGIRMVSEAVEKVGIVGAQHPEGTELKNDDSLVLVPPEEPEALKEFEESEKLLKTARAAKAELLKQADLSKETLEKFNEVINLYSHALSATRNALKEEAKDLLKPEEIIIKKRYIRDLIKTYNRIYPIAFWTRTRAQQRTNNKAENFAAKVARFLGARVWPGEPGPEYSYNKYGEAPVSGLSPRDSGGNLGEMGGIHLYTESRGGSGVAAERQSVENRMGGEISDLKEDGEYFDRVVFPESTFGNHIREGSLSRRLSQWAFFAMAKYLNRLAELYEINDRVINPSKEQVDRMDKFS